VLDLDPLDNATGFLNVGHGAADSRFKTVRFATESDDRHATALPRRAIRSQPASKSRSANSSVMSVPAARMISKSYVFM